MHLRNTPMASMAAKMEACAAVAKYSRGFSGAELANVVNEAALLAGRKGAQVSSLAHSLTRSLARLFVLAKRLEQPCSFVGYCTLRLIVVHEVLGATCASFRLHHRCADLRVMSVLHSWQHALARGKRVLQGCSG